MCGDAPAPILSYSSWSWAAKTLLPTILWMAPKQSNTTCCSTQGGRGDAGSVSLHPGRAGAAGVGAEQVPTCTPALKKKKVKTWKKVDVWIFQKTEVLWSSSIHCLTSFFKGFSQASIKLTPKTPHFYKTVSAKSSC